MSTMEAPKMPRLTQPKYDQSRQYHPFARMVREGEWIVQPPTSSKPIGVVRASVSEQGEPEFVVYAWHNGAAKSVPFDETHPTLFHAVSWLRWRLGARPA